MFVRKEYSVDDNNLNSNNPYTVFESNKKKYLIDPFNNLVKDELKYHHNTRIYNTAQFNKFKVIDVEHDMKDRIMYKKGVLKDVVICTRPIYPTKPHNDNIEFNIKIFGINTDNLLDNLKVDILLDQDVIIENVINKTIQFDIHECVLFQNTNILFIELIHNDMKFLLMYDLISKVLLKDEQGKVVKLEHQKVLYFEKDNKKRIFGIINNNVIKKYKIKSNQHSLMFLKNIPLNVTIPRSKEIYIKDDLYLCVDERDENELIIFETDLTTMPKTISLKAENNKVYNVNVSSDKTKIVTTSKKGTTVKVYTKNKDRYELFKTFKRGMNQSLNYLIGFSNDDSLIYSLSFNRTLHLYALNDINRSIHIIKLTSRVVDDVCTIKIMKDYNHAEVYYIYVLWRYTGLIEMYLFDREKVKSKKVAYTGLY